MAALDDRPIRALLLQAWLDSQPGTDSAHEEGGFILRQDDGTLSVERWPRGTQNQIVVPPHTGCMRSGKLIVATFHTHPNPGPEFEQEPSLTDVRAVRDDPDLKNSSYEGEYVVARQWTYRIDQDGKIVTLGQTDAVFKEK